MCANINTIICFIQEVIIILNNHIYFCPPKQYIMFLGSCSSSDPIPHSGIRIGTSTSVSSLVLHLRRQLHTSHSINTYYCCHANIILQNKPIVAQQYQQEELNLATVQPLPHSRNHRARCQAVFLHYPNWTLMLPSNHPKGASSARQFFRLLIWLNQKHGKHTKISPSSKKTHFSHCQIGNVKSSKYHVTGKTPFLEDI